MWVLIGVFVSWPSETFSFLWAVNLLPLQLVEA